MEKSNKYVKGKERNEYTREKNQNKQDGKADFCSMTSAEKVLRGTILIPNRRKQEIAGKEEMGAHLPRPHYMRCIHSHL